MPPHKPNKPSKCAKNLKSCLDELMESHWANGTQDFYNHCMKDADLVRLLEEKGIKDLKKFLLELRGVNKAGFLAVNNGGLCLLQTRFTNDKLTYHLPVADLTDTESSISGVRRLFLHLTGWNLPSTTCMPDLIWSDRSKPPREIYLLRLPPTDKQVGWKQFVQPDQGQAVGHQGIGHQGQAGAIPA